MTDRLSAQDASFLYLEGTKTPYHIGSLMIFEVGTAPSLVGPIDEATVAKQIAARLDLVPRFRQKLAWVPLGQGRPVWVDDDHFDVGYHVRSATVPSPGTDTELLTLCAELMEQHLSRTRPLWEVYVINGLANDRIAIFAKTHHAIVDGIAGVDATAILLDPTPEPNPGPVPSDGAAGAWRPSPPPGGTRMLRDALAERLRFPLDAARGLRRLARRPRRLLASAADVFAGIGDLVDIGLHPVPVSPLNVRVGPNRKLAYVRASLDDFRAIKAHLHGTVNDVVLSVMASAIRTWLVRRGEQTRGVVLDAMVPVNIRREDEATGGNRVSTIIVGLPMEESDPIRRFERIRAAALEAKHSHEVLGADLLIQLSGFAPPTLMAQIMKIQNVQRVFNLTITNIPGPTEPLYSAGHKLLDIIPFTPLAGNMGLIVAVVSYAGKMEFGLTADADAFGDLDVMARGLEDAIEELAGAAGIRSVFPVIEPEKRMPA